jgi:hypothetical protein
LAGFQSLSGLVFENLALRQQLAVLKRQARKPKLRTADRMLWVGLRGLWPDWQQALLLFQPQTIVAWHRLGFRLFGRQESRTRVGSGLGCSLDQQIPQWPLRHDRWSFGVQGTIVGDAWTIHKNLGGTVNALDACLVLRGLRTFSLRMEAHNRNGEAVAEWLLRRPEVARVHYPGIALYSQTELFRRQMKHGSALLSFELSGGEQAACRSLDRLGLILHAVSLGRMESLATRPSMSSHRGMTSEAWLRAGGSDSLIRLSVVVEVCEDMLADLEQAIVG